MKTNSVVNKVGLGLHVGNALKYATDNYSNIEKVLLELVQNALDSNATFIEIIINYKNRELFVRDNGVGISEEKFAKAIGSVCQSIKSKAKLGQFGIGMMSPLSKCKEYIITSTPKSSAVNYTAWYFNCKDILNSKALPDIPYEKMSNMIYSLKNKSIPGKRTCNWRTEVRLKNFNKDGKISSVDVNDLQTVIQGQFSIVMKKLKTEVHLKIIDTNRQGTETYFEAADFAGKKIETIVYESDHCGKTIFNLYVSPKTRKGRKGIISVGIKHNDARMVISKFGKSLHGLIKKETGRILSNGMFEGEIISEKCVMGTDRDSFIESDALLEFCIHLDSWVENHGLNEIAKVNDLEKDEWLYNIGSMAMLNFEKKLNEIPELKHFRNLLARFKSGTIGSGHYQYEDANNRQKVKTKNSKTNNQKKNEKPSFGNSKPKRDKPGHNPFSVQNPAGRFRKKVKGHSQGLQFLYEEFSGNPNHWEFNCETGELTFNIRSDVWEKMERSAKDKDLILYQEYITFKALELLSVPETKRDVVFDFLQAELSSASIFILHSSKYRYRGKIENIGRKLN